MCKIHSSRSSRSYKYVKQSYSNNKLIKYTNKSTCVSARDFGIIIGISPFQSHLSLLFEKCGYREDVKFTHAMQRGVDLEKEAVYMFAYMFNIPKDQMTFPGFTRHSVYDFVGGVPDALFKDHNGEPVIVEVKCPDKFSKYDEPSQYYDSQIQVYMNIFNASRAYYVEYIQNKGIRIIEVQRDDKWFEEIIPTVERFWDDVCYWRERDITSHRLFPGFVDNDRV